MNTAFGHLAAWLVRAEEAIKAYTLFSQLFDRFFTGRPRFQHLDCPHEVRFLLLPEGVRRRIVLSATYPQKYLS